MQIHVKLPPQPLIEYVIEIKNNALATLCTWFPEDCSTIVIICDENVASLYGFSLQENLKISGFKTLLLAFPAGEGSKNITTKNTLEEQMLQQGCDRKSLIVAFGGGVTGDLASYIAASFMRGVRYIHVPTTLLAVVDSSIGGKTGINNRIGKNLIGAFWQPIAVVADLNCLQSLAPEHLVNGLVEIAKIFLTHNQPMFDYLVKNLSNVLNKDSLVLEVICRKAIALKAAIVSSDPGEKGERALLNFGHTIGHALEVASDYQYLHGVAVGYGIVVESKIAELSGLLSAQDYQLIKQFFASLNIYGSELLKYQLEDLISRTYVDKKCRAGQVHYVLLNSVGSCAHRGYEYTFPVDTALVQLALSTVSKETHGGQ